MVDGVSHEVDDRREDALADRLVELRPGRLDLEPYLATARPHQRAHHQRDALENLGQRHHPHLEDG